MTEWQKTGWRAKERVQMPDYPDAGALARLYGAVIQGMSIQARDGAGREELLAMVDQVMSD